MFPLSLKGKMTVDTKNDASVDIVVREIDISLRASGLQNVVSGSGVVTFTNDAIFMWSFRIYALANHGTFSINLNDISMRIYYEIFVMRLFIVSGILVLFIALTLSPAKNLDLEEKLIIIFGLWVWLYGFNYILIWIRTRAFLRRSLRKLAA